MPIQQSVSSCIDPCQSHLDLIARLPRGWPEAARSYLIARTISSNGMVRPCSRPVSKRCLCEAPKTRSPAWQSPFVGIDREERHSDEPHPDVWVKSGPEASCPFTSASPPRADLRCRNSYVGFVQQATYRQEKSFCRCKLVHIRQSRDRSILDPISGQFRSRLNAARWNLQSFDRGEERT